MHRPARVRQPQREQEALGHLPGQAHPQIGEVDLGLRPGRVALRHEPGHHAGRPARLRPRPAAGGACTYSRRRSTTTRPRRARRAAARRSAGRCAAACAARPGPLAASRRSPATGSSTSVRRGGALRGGGTGEAIASRTVRRCTQYFSASARTDIWLRCQSNRIAAYSSTLDPIPAPSDDQHDVDHHRQVGPNQTVTTSPGVSVSRRTSGGRGQVGPNQTVTPGPNPGGRRSGRGRRGARSDRSRSTPRRRRGGWCSAGSGPTVRCRARRGRGRALGWW